MDTMNEILSAVSTVGFPIAAAIMVYLQSNKQNNAMIEAMNENTKVLTQLVERIANNE